MRGRFGRSLRWLATVAAVAACSDLAPEDVSTATGGSGGSTEAGTSGTGGTQSTSRDGGPAPSDATTTGDAGGDGGQGDAATAGSGATTGADDPAPLEPDLTGLVETSPRWVVFTEHKGAMVPDELRLLDLDSGVRHLVNPDGPVVAYVDWSPDGKVLLLSDANAASDRDFVVIRLGASGFVPGAPVDGVTGMPGNRSAFEWSADSRFVLERRGGSVTDGIEIVDTAALRLVTHVDFDNSTPLGGEFAPAGYHYTFWAAPMQGDYTRQLGRLTASGSTTPVELPFGAGVPFFDAAATRMFYATGDTDNKRVAIVELPGLRTRELEVSGASAPFDGYYTIGPDEQSVIGRTRPTPDTAVYVRTALDGNTPPEVVSDPARSVAFAMASENGAMWIFDYGDGVELLDIRSGARTPLPTLNMRNDVGGFTVGLVGEHAFYPAADGLHLAALDAAGSLVDVAIDPGPAEVCRSLIDEVLPNKAVLRVDGGRELVFADLSTPTAQVVGRMSPSADTATLYCPRWPHGGTTLGISEARETGGAFYLVPWSETTPEAPTLALESAEQLGIYAFMWQ